MQSKAPNPAPSAMPSTTQDLRNITCHFWRLNRCRYTSSTCPYAHFETGTPAPAPSAAPKSAPAQSKPNTKDLLCIYWAQNRCRHTNEADCPYVHRQIAAAEEDQADPMEGIEFTSAPAPQGPRADERRIQDLSRRMQNAPRGPRLVGGGGRVEKNRAEPRRGGWEGKDDGARGNAGRENEAKGYENEGRGEHGPGGRGHGNSWRPRDDGAREGQPGNWPRGRGNGPRGRPQERDRDWGWSGRRR